MRYKRLYTQLFKALKEFKDFEDSNNEKFGLDHIIINAEIREIDEKLRNTEKANYLHFEQFK